MCLDLARSAWGLMANSLVLTLVDGHRVFFTSFFNRDKCYNRIVDMSQDKENISRQDRTSSEPISTANSSQAHASVKTGDSKESEAASEEEPAWKRFDPRKQGGKSNELGDSGFLQVSGSSTKLAEVVDSFGEDGQVSLTVELGEIVYDIAPSRPRASCLKSRTLTCGR